MCRSHSINYIDYFNSKKKKKIDSSQLLFYFCSFSIIIHAVSRWGRGPDTEPIYVFIPERPHNSIELVIGIIIGFIIVIGFIIGCIVYIRRKYAPGVPNMKLIASVNPEYMSTAYVPDEWELPRNKVSVLANWFIAQTNPTCLLSPIELDPY